MNLTYEPSTHPNAAPFFILKRPDGSVRLGREEPDPALAAEGALTFLPRAVIYADGVMSPFDLERTGGVVNPMPTWEDLEAGRWPAHWPAPAPGTEPGANPG